MTKKERLTSLINKAGKAQTKASEAEKAYKDCRKELAEKFEEFDMIDKGITTEDFHAIFSRDWYDSIDTNQFLKMVPDDKLRAQLLSVKITGARKLLKKAIQRKLIKHLQDDEPTLHVRKLQNGEE